MEDIKNVIIIGSGPAGHTAAIYTARAELQPLMFEGFMAGGIAAGGQLTTTSSVENFPGFPDGIDGPELMVNMRSQSEKFGTEIRTETVENINIHAQEHGKNHFEVISYGKSYYAKSLIISTGAIARRLGVTNEDTFWDKGISACAVCDGALPIFRDKPLAVIGGGDSACEEAQFLSKFGSKIFLVVRRDELRASKAMQKRVLDNPKIEILWQHSVTAAHGSKFLEKIDLCSTKDSALSSLTVSGLFYAIGHTPNTSFLPKDIKTDDMNYIVTNPGTTQTSVKGIFACGDVQDSKYRQAITAAGSGCMAALEVEHFLS